jgi:transposase
MSLNRFEEPTAIRTNLGAIFVSLELKPFDLADHVALPGGGEKMSKHSVSAGDIAALLARLSELKQKAFARTGKSFQVIVIQEAGLDGFWIHRVLQGERVESHVVDPASIATRRRRRAKLTRSMAKPWCALCWRTNAANRVSAPWSGRRLQRRKTAADFAVSARR